MTVAMSDAEGITCDSCRRYLRWRLEAASRRKYRLTDHLGSVAAITDDEGTLLDQQRYYPFGKERLNVGSITQTDFGYTGQRDLPSMGLMDYKARFYDSNTGRFIQPDTIIPNPADPQSWNRFAYVQGNPIRYSDPSGYKEACGLFGADCESEPPAPSGLLDPGHPDYVGPIPDDIVQQLVQQGADPIFLSMVTIHNKQDARWKSHCRDDASAVTWESTVYFCTNKPQYWDPTEATPTLLHELIHVSQFLEYPVEIREELRWIGVLKKRDDAIARWNRGWFGVYLGQIEWQRFNPYLHSWVEKQGMDCAVAFTVDASLRLDSGTCNLAPFD